MSSKVTITGGFFMGNTVYLQATNHRIMNRLSRVVLLLFLSVIASIQCVAQSSNFGGIGSGLQIGAYKTLRLN